MRAKYLKVRVRRRQQGLTLIEILIAMLIGLFLLGALLTIVQTNRAVFGNQTQLALLHDSERMAMAMMTDVIQSAGYFPDPTTNTSALLTPAAPFASSGQAISGTYSATAPDSLSVRYYTTGGDKILNCSGLSNTSAVTSPPLPYANTFQIVNGQLVCTMNGVPYNLVSGATNSSTTLGITDMKVLYGVKTNVASVGNNVDTYLNADQLNAISPALWLSVISVRVTLTFTNPMYVAGTAQPATVGIQRVINVMNQVGPTL
jgi:type IV pilus assembly protein PilW